jgi:phenylpyruvate tautomerase
MPLIKVHTSAIVGLEQQASLLNQLSKQLAKQLNKPEAYVMTALDSGMAMTFGGTSDPACYIEIKSIGVLTPEQTQAMTLIFCELIEQTLGVPRSRTYIEFTNAIGPMWGWNGDTFG